MKYLIAIAVLFPGLACCQTGDHRALLDSLKLVTDMPYICRSGVGETTNSPVPPSGCGDKLFWKVVKQKQQVIIPLIEKLADTTQTAATVPTFGGYYTVADVAYKALEEIIAGIPTFALLKVKFDSKGCGYCSYWHHVRKDVKNRREFQSAVRQWYEKNKQGLTWVTGDDFSICDCQGKHPNGGHFALKK
jgi:hypothetical protein